MVSKSTRILALFGSLAVGSGPLACGSDDATNSLPADAGSDAANDSSFGGSSGSGGSAGSGASAGSGGVAGSAGDAATDSSVEVCGNGLDDDRDGSVDEDCPCQAGETQACYGGAPENAGVGACIMGTQACVPTSATSAAYGDCYGWIEPVDELCNQLDDDCDGAVDEGEGGGKLVAWCPEGGQTTCASNGAWTACELCNGSDEDGDGQFDEELVRACDDHCSQMGFQTCESTTWTDCVPSRTFDPSYERGGIVVDSVTIGSGTADTLSFAHTVSSTLDNRLVLAGVALDTPTTISSVSYAGMALTKVASWTADSGFEELRVEVFYLLDPPTGTADLSITLAEARTIRAGVYSMGNVGSAPELLGAAKDRSSTPKYTATASPAGLVIDFIAKEAEHEITQASQNELGWNLCGPGYARFGSSIRPSEGPTNLYWTFYCCPDEWILGAVLVSPP